CNRLDLSLAIPTYSLTVLIVGRLLDTGSRSRLGFLRIPLVAARYGRLSMRPGSCPRQPLSPPGPSRSMRRAIATALPIVLLLILLPSLASASPPDRSWVTGFYDGADGDEIVSLVYDTFAASAAAPSHFGPLPRLLEMSLESIARNVPEYHFTFGPRSPPVLRSPEIAPVFNALLHGASLTDASVPRPSLAKLRQSPCCGPR